MPYESERAFDQLFQFLYFIPQNFMKASIKISFAKILLILQFEVIQPIYFFEVGLFMATAGLETIQRPC